MGIKLGSNGNITIYIYIHTYIHIYIYTYIYIYDMEISWGYNQPCAMVATVTWDSRPSCCYGLILMD